ncbi:carbon-nitrogen hydrolase family protein [Dethiobacter alkaliphilus]|uniref:carbon-nitrogen hydrolase family protein n=1 Tax=Dethiobacter alkaliphilus TaxID=427926 RepID=UPI002227C602|nr:carbon-nitrogen hydrolase family protein [Dethiobacter alkaliphilus]MCW3489463.1 carbon-nitrogen hydrolase family protein [Dethiobacter alkaliphilus]
MHVMALSFTDSDFTTPGAYREYLLQTIPSTENRETLIVLPSFTALYLAYLYGELADMHGLDEATRKFINLPQSWHDDITALQQTIARDLKAWLVPGTTFVRSNGRTYHQSCLISPQGEIIGRQHQAFLSRREQRWGLSRGDDLHVFKAGNYTVGIIIGTDAWYPETGRILALKGADLICHPGAMPAGDNRWRQLAAMWQQVQQNQFFCVESQLNSMIAGEDFAAASQIHAPCEMTEGFTGILAKESATGLAHAVLEANTRRKVISNYPLLKLQNPAAYRPLACPGGVNIED